MRFDAFVGVDFSGARDAGRRIWIARGREDASRLAVQSVVPATALPGGGPGPEAAWAALRAAIAAARDSLVGIDMPFGLPLAVVAESDWRGFVAAFAARHADADSFRAAMCAFGFGEAKRRTDVETKTPFGGWNVRMYRQTYAALSHVLAPLVAADAVRAAPMQPPAPGKPVLIEVCPASTLKHAGLYFPYKQRGADGAAARAAILDGLTARGAVAPLPAGLRAVVLADPGGDALDAVIAAASAFKARDDAGLATPRDAREAIEGRVFY
ncbi:MAG: DUF429 domain-containing protein [Rhodospirillales bacterium]